MAWLCAVLKWLQCACLACACLGLPHCSICSCAVSGVLILLFSNVIITCHVCRLVSWLYACSSPPIPLLFYLVLRLRSPAVSTCVLTVCDCLSWHKAQLAVLTLAHHAAAEEQMAQLQVLPLARCTFSVALCIHVVSCCSLVCLLYLQLHKLAPWRCPSCCAVLYVLHGLGEQ